MSRSDFPGAQSGFGAIVRNASVAAQTVSAATRTYLTGSALHVPLGGLKAGARLRWVLSMTKTAAGTAVSTFDLAFGTAGTTADSARVSFTKPAGTAVADEANVVIEAIVRSVSATGAVVGQLNLTHNLAATGHAQIPSVNVTTVSSAFDNSSEELIVGVCLTSGASDAITVQLVKAELVQDLAS